MTKKQKNIVLFTFLCIIWLLCVGALVIGIVWGAELGITGKVSAIVGILGSPLISQLFGIWPKIIHYKKVKKETDKLEKVKEEIKKQNTRGRIFDNK